MPRRRSLVVKEPVSKLKQPLKVNFVKLIQSVGKGSIEAVTLNFPGLAKECLGLLDAVGLGKDPGQMAWLLILGSLSSAMAALLEENTSLLTRDPNELDEIGALVREKLKSGRITIDREFLARPSSLSIFADVKDVFTGWLQQRGASADRASSIAAGLPAYFTRAFNEEWLAHADWYEPISTFFDGPARETEEREFGWLEYSSRLQRIVQEPLFDEMFSISDVYVPLRGYFKERAQKESQQRNIRARLASSGRDEDVSRIVVDARQYLEAWLKDRKGHMVRVVSGGPGAGKSTFAKMLAADLSRKGHRVLVVPLHALDLNKRSLHEALDYWAEGEPAVPADAFHVKKGDPPALIIFDGLDELAMTGKIAQELAKEFVGDLDRLTERFRQIDVQVKILLTGRELVVQSIARTYAQSGQVLQLLPYYVDEHRRRSFADSQELLKVDQRHLWWRTYGVASGKGYDCLPPELDRADMIPVTAEPLLNYLVALVYEPGKTSEAFSGNRNDIYRHLLEKVHERVWEADAHPGAKGLKLEEFKETLEEIALAAWHGEGRSITAEAVKKRCKNARLTHVLCEYEGELEKGVLKLLTAFYIRKTEHGDSSEATFEFTHKSFGEYLTACGIVRALEAMHDEFSRHAARRKRGWDEPTALKNWALLCGPTALDFDLLQFLRDEILCRDAETVEAWQGTLVHLIEYMLHHGMPMELVETCRTYQEQCVQARNAEEALLAALNACVRFRMPRLLENEEAEHRDAIKISWPSPTSLGDWLHRIVGQTSSYGLNKPISVDCLCLLDLSDCVLANHDLSRADLRRSILSNVEMRRNNLAVADLDGSDLSGADLSNANLEWANLSGANLSGANLSGADLSNANLEWANLSRANLSKADLSWADLSWADLSWADLSEADFSDANFSDANLSGVKGLQ